MANKTIWMTLASLALVMTPGLTAQTTENAGKAAPAVAENFAPVAAVRTSPDAAWLVNGARVAQERAAEAPRHQALWKASLMAVAAASAVDVHSSWGKREMNPLLADASGRFAGRGLAIKSLITGGALGAQWLIVHKKPSMAKYAAIGNFAMAGIYTRIAIHNYGNSR